MTAVAASTAALATLAGWALAGWSLSAFYVATAGLALCAWGGRTFTTRVLGGIGRPVQDLRTLTEIFDRLGPETFEAPRLVQLHRSLAGEGVPPGRSIAQLGRWLEIHESKRNVFFAILAFYLVWDLQLAAWSRDGVAGSARPRSAGSPHSARSRRW